MIFSWRKKWTKSIEISSQIDNYW